MQAVESDALEAAGLVKSVDDKNLETINLIVVGIIVVFCLRHAGQQPVRATTYRGGEFGRQRSPGRPGQVLAMVATGSCWSR